MDIITRASTAAAHHRPSDRAERGGTAQTAERAGSGRCPAEPAGVGETEALRPVAAGLSNAEVAGRLVVEASTVNTDVNRLVAKPDLRDRVQAVVYAYVTGLVRVGR